MYIKLFSLTKRKEGKYDRLRTEREREKKDQEKEKNQEAVKSNGRIVWERVVH